MHDAAVLALLVLLLLMPALAAALDADCTPASCGNLSIRYPFWLRGRQPPYCGYPSFGIDCDPAGALLTINPAQGSRSWRWWRAGRARTCVHGRRARVCVCARQTRRLCARVSCVVQRVCVRRARMAVHEPVRGARVIAGERVCAREPWWR